MARPKNNPAKKSGAPSGGAATAYGILYQLLGSLEHACRLTLDAQTDGGEIVGARLILEPHAGGDLVALRAGRRVVEQWKSRRQGRPWSLGEIIGDVLPDLFQAVDADRFSDATEYRFCTEGRIGDWREARCFFESLSNRDVTTFSADLLDDVQAVRFMASRPPETPRTFFLRMADELTQALQKRGQHLSESELHRRLCHLLAHFDIPPPQSAEDLEAKVDAMLKPWVDHEEDIEKKRHELCSRLLELASEGHAEIDVDQFFEDCGLRATPWSRWQEIRDRLNTLAARDAARVFQYDPSKEVRQPPPWPADEAMLVLKGGSGVGKTWQLACLASQAGASTAIVLLRSIGTCDADLRQAAETVWHHGTKRDHAPPPFSRMAERLRAANASPPDPWLTLLIDDVTSPDEVRRLREQNWVDWGIRIAITVPENLSVEEIVGKEAVREVQEFTNLQLRQFLGQHGRGWADIPADVREQLRRPLLAAIYCDLAPTSLWHPQSEYDVFSAAWQKLRRELPEDASLLRDLVQTLIAEQSVGYPWTTATCLSHHLDRHAIERLLRRGWLGRHQGDIVVGHQRLLNWILAESLADRLRRSDGAVEAVCQVLTSIAGQDQIIQRVYLGYVLMDLLWIVSEPSFPNCGAVAALLKTAEQNPQYRGFPKVLYEDLLPTLGERIVDGIVQRLRKDPPRGHSLLPNLAAASLNRIGGAAAVRAARALLGDENEPVRGVGLKVLAVHPSKDTLEQLWKEIQRLRGPEPEAPGDDHNRFYATDCASAIRSCARLSPAWLAQTIRSNGADPSSAPLLSDLLTRMEGSEPADVWRETADLFIASLAERPEALAACIVRFRDVTRVPLLEQWFASGNPRKVLAGFQAMCLLAPHRALEMLPGLPGSELALRSGWFEPLWQADPQILRDRIREIMERSPDEAASIGRVYVSQSHRMDAKSLGALLAALDALLVKDASGESQDGGPIDRLLELLGRLSKKEHLDALEALRGSALDERLSEWARRWLTASPYRHDQGVQRVEAVLLRIGGDGFTAFLNERLCHPSEHVRLHAIDRATIRPNSETIRRLVAISESDEAFEHSLPEKVPILQHAIGALAVLEENAALVRAIVRHSAEVEPLRRLRAHLSSISDADLAPAIEATASSDPMVRKRGFFAIAVSGREDLLPLVRQALSQAAPTDEDSLGALWALFGLVGKDDASVALFASHLAHRNHRHVAMAGLLQTERSEARSILVAELARLDPNVPYGPDGALPIELAGYPETREAALRYIRGVQLEGPLIHTLFGDLRSIKLLGEVGEDSAVLEFLLQEAAPPEHATHVTGRRREAVRALGRHNPDAAFEAAEAALVRGRHDRQMFPGVLMDLDEERAIPLLCSQLSDERQPLVRRSMLIALRQAKNARLTERHTRSLLQGNANSRFAAAQIARWVPESVSDEKLRTLSEAEPIAYVREAFMEAVSSRERDRHALQLLDDLVESRGPRQWYIVDVLFHSVAPECLGRKGDTLWIGPAYDHLSLTLQDDVQDRYRKALERIKQEHRP